MKLFLYLPLVAVLGIGIGTASVFAIESTDSVLIADGPSIQAALNAHPGEIIFVPPGDYEISKPIEITQDRSGLVGLGRIIQTNPEAAVVLVSGASDVQIRDLTLTRTTTVANRSALLAMKCRGLSIDNVRVIDNRAATGAINLDECVDGRITDSLVRNYMRISIEDRTTSADHGYAFKCIDGTGIQLTRCQGMLVQGNRVEELDNLPTPEIREKYDLGTFTAKTPIKGRLIGQEIWDRETIPQWHQGAAICVGGDPTVSDRILIQGNFIENAAQGIDLHSDHVTLSENIINNTAAGMKAMHGARNILIIGNQFNKCSLWAILLQPGASSHAAGQPAYEGEDPARSPANNDGASIIANNIISDFGYGTANWIWGNDRECIRLDVGQTRENPPLSDVIITGNIVYDPGRDKILVDGKAIEAPPRYRYALSIPTTSDEFRVPVGIRVENNMLHPGSGGVANVPLDKELKWSSN